MAWTDTIKQLAPTVISAVGGPFSGVAMAALGAILGVDEPTHEKLEAAIEQGQMTPEHVAEIKKLELQYQENEKEQGFKYAELEFRDRDSARNANTSGGIQKPLLVVSCLLLALSLGAECLVLFAGYPERISEIVVGRVLGLLDSVAMLVLSYYYGTSHGSTVKTEQLANR